MSKSIDRLKEEVKTVYVSVDKLIPADYNPRYWSEKAIADLTESIKKFGLKDPLLVNSYKDRKNIVIGGHFRLKIAKELGLKIVPVIYMSLNLEEEKEFNLRLNKNQGDWDWDLLGEYEENLLTDVGFSEVELSYIKIEPDDIEDISDKLEKGKYNYIIECDSPEEFDDLKKKYQLKGKKINYKEFKKFFSL